MSYIQKLIDSQDNIVIICDKNFNVKYYNKAFSKFFKKKRIKEIIDLVKKNKINNKTIKLKNYKGDKYSFKLKVTNIDDDIVINLNDITGYEAYKKSLLTSNISFLEYKKLIDKFLIVSSTDKDGIITYANDEFVKVSGYSKEELIGKPHNIVRHPDMPKHVFKAMWDTIKSGKIWQGVVKNRKKNGEPYYVKTIIAPFFDSDDNIKEYIALRVDITELIKAKEKAQKEKKSKEMFLANMSHEIRTPLTGIIGFIDLLKQKSLPEDIKNIINIIDNSADTLLSVVNDILEISKIETEGITINNKAFYAKSSFENTINLFKAKAEEKNIHYISNINIDFCIVSDEHRLKQVLSNLIGNSIKFTPNNGTVIVNIDSYEKNNKVVVDFSVEDNGVGIPKDKQQKLFTPFFQTDSLNEGTGLGLFISYQIIEKLGGKLQLESEENKGTKFYFRLEFEKCEKIVQQETDDIYVKGKILVAEDDKVIQEYLKAILKTKGDVEIVVVDNGKEALEKFKNDKFDLVFLDSFMPIMKGEEVVKEILEYEKQNNLSHTPLINLTANVFNVDKSQYLINGFDDYLLKPIDNKRLDNIMKKYLTNHNEKNDNSLNNNFIQELRDVYFEHIFGDLEKLKQAIKENSLEKIGDIAHKIAGSSFAVEFDEIAKLAKNIENSAREKKSIDYLKLFDKINNKINEIKKRI